MRKADSGPWNCVFEFIVRCTRVFETRTATGREHFAFQDSGVSKIFTPVLSNKETILSNVNVVV